MRPLPFRLHARELLCIDANNLHGLNIQFRPSVPPQSSRSTCTTPFSYELPMGSRVLAAGLLLSMQNPLSGHTTHTHTHTHTRCHTLKAVFTKQTVLQLPRLTKGNEVAVFINEKCSVKSSRFVMYPEMLFVGTTPQPNNSIKCLSLCYTLPLQSLSSTNVRRWLSQCKLCGRRLSFDRLVFSPSSAPAPSRLHKSKTNPPSASSSLLICLPALRP